MNKPKSTDAGGEKEVSRIEENQFLLHGEVDPEFSHLIHFHGTMYCFVCKEQTTYAVDGGSVSADIFSDAHIHRAESTDAIKQMPNRLREQIVTEASPNEIPTEQSYVPAQGEEVVKPDLDDDDDPPPSKKNDGDVVEIIKF